MRTQEINLECELQVIMDHDSKTQCKNCNKEILWATTKNKKSIPVELVSLSKWDIHCCEIIDQKEEIIKLLSHPDVYNKQVSAIIGLIRK